jgi:hypothetical protein
MSIGHVGSYCHGDVAKCTATPTCAAAFKVLSEEVRVHHPRNFLRHGPPLSRAQDVVPRPRRATENFAVRCGCRTGNFRAQTTTGGRPRCDLRPPAGQRVRSPRVLPSVHRKPCDTRPRSSVAGAGAGMAPESSELKQQQAEGLGAVDLHLQSTAIFFREQNRGRGSNALSNAGGADAPADGADPQANDDDGCLLPRFVDVTHASGLPIGNVAW